MFSNQSPKVHGIKKLIYHDATVALSMLFALARTAVDPPVDAGVSFEQCQMIDEKL
jgi:hypothetical protein